MTLGISKRLDIVDGEGERAISSGSSRVQSQGVLARRNDGFLILNNEARSLRISQTSRLRILKDQLVGLVRREIVLVRRQGGGQLKWNRIVHVVVSRILPPSGSAFGVVGILDLLLEGRLIGLAGDGHDFIANNLDNVQSSCIITGHSVLVLGEVITSRDLAQLSCGRYCAVCIASQINELVDSFKLHRIGGTALKPSHLLGSISG